MQSRWETSLNKAIVQVKEILSRLVAGLKMKILKGPHWGSGEGRVCLLRSIVRVVVCFD